MTRLRQTVLLALGACLAAPSLPAQQQQATTPAPTPPLPATPPLVELRDGDVFVFLGDSITHQALHTQYLETFHLTRYPERDLRFHNAGVSGDRAADALRRFDRDVAHYRPTHVSVLLGMNDAGYTAWKQEIFERYVTDMSALLDRLAETGAGVSLIHPTMFDSRANRMAGESREPTVSRYNGALAYFGEWCRETAWQRGLGFADPHGPLNRLTFEQRRKDPRFTLIDDSVHPGPDGQVVMAVAMLDEVFARARPVGDITLSRGGDGKLGVEAPGTAITDLSESEDGTVAFTGLAAALPWVVPEDARLGYRLTRAGQRHSAERFAVQGLAPGHYELLIDGAVVGAWPHSRLARGIELQENAGTPQYQQALAVANGNAERNQRHVKALRDWWLQRKVREYQLAEVANAGDPAALARGRADHATWLTTGFEPGIDRAEAEAAKAWDALRRLARPAPHRYELRPVSRAKDAAP